ncbi:hypothetical protein ACFQMM_01175 [Saliphagus sp. GCM10025308]
MIGACGFLGSLAGCLSDEDNNSENEEEGNGDTDEGNGGKSEDEPQEEHVNAAASVDGNTVTITDLGNADGLFCSSADVESVSDIEDGVNGGTSTGSSFECESGDGVIGINKAGTTTRITSVD